MKNKGSIKKIALLNPLLALVAAVVVYLFQLLSGDELDFPYLPVMGFIIVFAIGSIDLQILRRVQNHPENKFLWYLLTYVTSSAVYLMVWPPFSRFVDAKWEYDNFNLLFTLVLAGAVLNTAILLIQHFMCLQQEKAQAELQVLQLKAVNAEASNLLLRQQIQPHFLFNSLSNLKALYNENQEAGESYLVHLANFLRTSLSSQSQTVSSLKDELAFLNDYLKMQKIRFGNALEYDIAIAQEDREKYHLPSFTLQLLVENAIKHNEITAELPLVISIFQQNDKLWVVNNARKKQSPEVSMGLGLANLAERYRLLSGDDLEIQEDKNQFRVILQLL